MIVCTQTNNKWVSLPWAYVNCGVGNLASSYSLTWLLWVIFANAINYTVNFWSFSLNGFGLSVPVKNESDYDPLTIKMAVATRRGEAMESQEGAEPSCADRKKSSEEASSDRAASAEIDLCAEAQWELAGADRNWREGPDLSALRMKASFDIAVMSSFLLRLRQVRTKRGFGEWRDQRSGAQREEKRRSVASSNTGPKGKGKRTNIGPE
jgi:hypothetical protein